MLALLLPSLSSLLAQYSPQIRVECLLGTFKDVSVLCYLKAEKLSRMHYGRNMGPQLLLPGLQGRALLLRNKLSMERSKESFIKFGIDQESSGRMEYLSQMGGSPETGKVLCVPFRSFLLV